MGGGKKGAGGGECRERLLTPSSSRIYTFLRTFCLSRIAVRARCTANDNQLTAPSNARARARETCIPYFASNARSAEELSINEISMMHLSSLQGPHFRSSRFFRRRCICVKHIRECEFSHELIRSLTENHTIVSRKTNSIKVTKKIYYYTMILIFNFQFQKYFTKYINFILKLLFSFIMYRRNLFNFTIYVF